MHGRDIWQDPADAYVKLSYLQYGEGSVVVTTKWWDSLTDIQKETVRRVLAPYDPKTSFEGRMRIGLEKYGSLTDNQAARLDDFFTKKGLNLPPRPVKKNDSLNLSQEVLGLTSMMETDPSLQPPKEWMDKLRKQGKADQLIGWIWYHKLDDEGRALIRGRYGKHYGKAGA